MSLQVLGLMKRQLAEYRRLASRAGTAAPPRALTFTFSCGSRGAAAQQRRHTKLETLNSARQLTLHFCVPHTEVGRTAAPPTADMGGEGAGVGHQRPARADEEAGVITSAWRVCKYKRRSFEL